MAAVDEHDTFLRQDNATIRVQVIADVDVNAVFDLFDLRAKILGREGPAQPATKTRQQESSLSLFSCCLPGQIGWPRRY